MTVDLETLDWAAFGEEFFEHYRQGGFGRLPKREIDILVFHLLQHFNQMFCFLVKF